MTAVGKRAAGTELSDAEHEQRVNAAKSRWAKYGAAAVSVAAAGAAAFLAHRRISGKLAEQAAARAYHQGLRGGKLVLRQPVSVRGRRAYRARVDEPGSIKTSHGQEPPARQPAADDARYAQEATQHFQRNLARLVRQKREAAAEAARQARVGASAQAGDAWRGRAAQVKGAGGGAAPPKMKPMSYQTALERLMSRRIDKRETGTELSEAEHQQRVDAARARWAGHVLNAKGQPRQRASAARPRDANGRIRPYSAEEMQSRWQQAWERQQQKHLRPAGYTSQGQLRGGDGQFAGYSVSRRVGEAAGQAVGGEAVGRLTGKITEALHAATHLESHEEKGRLIGAGTGVGLAAALGSRQGKKVLGQGLSYLIGRADRATKLGARTRVALGPTAARFLRAGLREAGPVLANMATNRKLTVPALAGVGALAGAHLGSKLDPVKKSGGPRLFWEVLLGG